MEYPNSVYDYFSGIRELRLRARALERRGEYLRERARGSFSCRPFRSGSGDTTLQERRLMELIENNELLRGVMDELLERERIAQELISGLKDMRMRMALQDRFLTGMSWEEIAAAQFYSTRYLRKLCSEGLRLVQPAYRELAEREGAEE